MKSPDDGGADAVLTVFSAGCVENYWTVGISPSLLALFHCYKQPDLLFLHFAKRCLKERSLLAKYLGCCATVPSYLLPSACV